MGSKFSESFPEILEQALELNQMLTAIALVILFTGLIISAWRGSMGGGTEEMLRAVARTAVLAILIRFFPTWTNELIGLSHILVEQLDADPSESHQEFARLLGAGDEEGGDVTFWDVLWSDESSIGKSLIYFFVQILGRLAFIVMWLGYLLQHVIAAFAIAVSPVFLAMFALNATRGVAIKFILSLHGVLLWPLGWASCDLLTDALLRFAAEDKIYVLTSPDSALSGIQTLPFILILSLWISVSMIAAPRLISRAIQEGSQIGVALLGSVGVGLGQGFSYSLGAGVTASLAGGSFFIAGPAAIAGGTGGVVSAAMGSSGVVVPTAIGTMAVMAASPSSSRGRNVNEEAAAIARKNR